MKNETDPRKNPAPTPAEATHAAPGAVRYDVSQLTDDDLYLFNEGSHYRLYEKFGAHLMTAGGEEGVYFAVWAPDAERIAVIGDFNGWNRDSHPLRPRGSSGIWEGFIPGVTQATAYKYYIASRYHGYRVEKADPFAFHTETPPNTASKVWDIDHNWNDQDWLATRRGRNALNAPVAIYEVHLGSWMRKPEDGNRSLSYREVAGPLAEYVKRMNFTHIEFLPIMEHPFFGSWGYQTTGYFAPTSRYGTPEDFMYLVDHLHQNGIGVILDWVPSHFPGDEFALGYFDGTHLYEHADPRVGLHPDWDSLIFNYSRNEVRSYLISSAFFWLDRYHADGLRLDAVASMLYLDYSRKQGEWIPNRYGGRENIEAMDFLRQLNSAIYASFPDVQTFAEESTAWPMVSRPVYVGGLGFGLKWDMGWMHDTLQYLRRDPIHRRHHHNELTFRMVYAFMENFVLPLSHDEVVHGKGSLIGQMPGDDWQKFANLRLLFSYMYSQPGKKLLFMGGELAQWSEWNHDASVEWHLQEYLPHQGIQRLVEDINRTYREQPALHELDLDSAGFEWIDTNDDDASVLSYLRNSSSHRESIVVVLNFTPVPRGNYRIGAPVPGHYEEIFNSDSLLYGGSGQGNLGGVESVPIPLHGRSHSLTINVPPLGAVFFKAPSPDTA